MAYPYQYGNGLPRGARIPDEDKPDIPQPQSSRRGEAPDPRRGKRLAWMLFSMLWGAGLTHLGWANYAENKLYTHEEVIEIVDGISKAVATRAFQFGVQECRRRRETNI